MNWKELFVLTKAKVIVLVVLLLAMNFIPTGSICADGINTDGSGFGYCKTYHGVPFTSIATSGVSAFTLNFLPSINYRFIGILGNFLIAYIIVLLSSIVYNKLRK